MQEIENACRGKKETIEGPLRFGASDHVTNYLLVETVHEIRESYPDLIPSISSSAPNDIIARLLTNEIEFGLFFTQVNVPQIIYEDLFSIEMAVVTSGKNAKDLKKEMSPADLRSFIQKQGFITSIQTHYQNSPSEELLKLVGESSQIIFECNSQEAQKRFCLQGKGVAFLAKFMVEDELKSGKLVALPLKKSIILNLYLARGRGRSTSAGARAFLDLLKTRYKLSK